MSRDPRVTAYIARARPFARPLLRHVRALVHRAIPGATETVKWGMPFFEVDGRAFFMMAAFNAHCAFGFREGKAVVGAADRSGEGMGQLGRITSRDDLPSDTRLVAWIRKGARLAAAPRARRGANAVLDTAARRPRRAPPRTPTDFAAALKASPDAARHYATFPPGARAEYVEWVTEARQPATRARRITQAVAWIAEGKRRNWKYERSGEA